MYIYIYILYICIYYIYVYYYIILLFCEQERKFESLEKIYNVILK